MDKINESQGGAEKSASLKGLVGKLQGIKRKVPLLYLELRDLFFPFEAGQLMGRR